MWKNLSRILSAPRFSGHAAGARFVSTEFSTRTHNCGELRLEHEGSKVKLSGWVQFLRLDKFLVLRDAHGTVQCVVPESNSRLWARINEIPLESVMSVRGEVIRRPQGQENSRMGTGEIEISLEEVEHVSMAVRNLPFFPGRDHNKVKEETAGSKTYPRKRKAKTEEENSQDKAGTKKRKSSKDEQAKPKRSYQKKK